MFFRLVPEQERVRVLSRACTTQPHAKHPIVWLCMSGAFLSLLLGLLHLTWLTNIIFFFHKQFSVNVQVCVEDQDLNLLQLNLD